MKIVHTASEISDTKIREQIGINYSDMKSSFGLIRPSGGEEEDVSAANCNIIALVKE